MNQANKSLLRHLFIASIAVVTLSACGQGFKALDAGSNSGEGSFTVTDPNTGQAVTSDKAWSQAAELGNGLVDGGSSSGALVVKIDKEREALVLVMPLPPIFLLPMAGAPIPELPGASFEMTVSNDGKSAMAIVIPLKYVLKGASFGTYGRLPNGDPIPFIPAGEATGFALSFPQKPSYRLHVYLAVNAAAVFVETPDWKLPDEMALLPTIGFPVRNAAKTQIVGYFAVVPNRGNFSSGVYVATRLPRQVAVLIDELLRL